MKAIGTDQCNCGRPRTEMRLTGPGLRRPAAYTGVLSQRS